jgi:hypothetical protein
LSAEEALDLKNRLAPGVVQVSCEAVNASVKVTPPAALFETVRMFQAEPPVCTVCAAAPLKFTVPPPLPKVPLLVQFPPTLTVPDDEVNEQVLFIVRLLRTVTSLVMELVVEAVKFAR